MAREQLKTLTEPMYYILLSLIRENHGYGIMQRISQLTEGRVTVGAGTLYTLLGRFEKEKIIIQVAEENRRKIYKLSEKGQNILKEEFERLNKMVRDGQKFMDYEGTRPDPPEDNTGTGISMPVNQTADQQAAAPAGGKDRETPRGDGQPEKGFGTGNLRKGAFFPV